MLGFLRYIWRRSDGSAAIEFALVCIPLLLITIGIMEFSFALFQWNSAEKATQMGVRTAVVSTPVAGGLLDFTGKDVGGANSYGDEPMPAFNGGVIITCDGGATPPDCTGPYTFEPDPHDRIVARMRRIFPRLTTANVVVEYMPVPGGLGFVGRPCGPVPSVTVRLQNMSFDFIVIDSLLSLVGGGLASSLLMPSFTATMVGEDLSTVGNTPGNPQGPTCL